MKGTNGMGLLGEWLELCFVDCQRCMKLLLGGEVFLGPNLQLKT